MHEGDTNSKYAIDVTTLGNNSSISVDNNTTTYISSGVVTVDDSTWASAPPVIDVQDFYNRIERLEKTIGITSRRPRLENEYPDLKELGDQMDNVIDTINTTVSKAISRIADAYNRLEDECKIMEKLKSNNDPE